MKDAIITKFQSVLSRDLKPWLKNDVELPTLTVGYLSGLSNLSVDLVIKLIESQIISLTDNQGVSWQPQLITEIPPTQEKKIIEVTARTKRGKLTTIEQNKNERITRDLNDVRQINQAGLNLNPKRLISQSRYESRAPGGGPVVKAGFQQKNLTGQFEAAVKEKMKVIFVNQVDL